MRQHSTGLAESARISLQLVSASFSHSSGWEERRWGRRRRRGESRQKEGERERQKERARERWEAGAVCLVRKVQPNLIRLSNGGVVSFVQNIRGISLS